MKKISLFFALILFSSVGVSMSIFSKSNEESVVLFSGVSGILTFKGEPAVGASLERRAKWDGGDGFVETVEVDSLGKFSFDKIEDSLSLNPLNQLVISQKIFAFYQGEKYKLWVMGKMSKDENAEFGGEPIDFRCELTQPIVRIESLNGLLGTSCKWDVVK